MRPLNQPLPKIWSRISLFIWLAVSGSLLAVAAASSRTGKPTWWVDGIWGIPTLLTSTTPFLAPAIALAARRWLPTRLVFLQFIAVIWLFLIAVSDLDRAPGAAVVELTIAGAALLGVISTLAGLPLQHVKSAHIPS